MRIRRGSPARSLPGPWLIDAEGNATADPRVLIGEAKGALLPLGGLDAGHKGYRARAS